MGEQDMSIAEPVTPLAIPHESDASLAPRLSFWQGFWLPVTHLFRPKALGMKLGDCPVFALTSSFVIGLVFLSLTVFSLLVVDRIIRGREFAVALADCVSGRKREEGFVALFGAPLGFIVVSVILAVLRFPGLHRSGSPWRTLARGMRSSGTMVWLAALLAVVGYYTVTVADEGIRQVVRSSSRDDVEGIMAFVGVSLLFWGLVWWVRQLDEGMVSRQNVPDLPMVCEGCGYQLMDEQAATVCSECGRPAADSLLRARSRWASGWEESPKIGTWLKAIWTGFWTPTVTYGSMPMRDGMRASGRFVILTFMAIGIGAYGWCFTMYSIDTLLSRPRSPLGFDWVVALGIPIVPGCVCPMVGWLWHRGIGAVVALAVAWQAPLRDGRWLLKLLNYESCYLLLHCALNGTLLSVFILAPGRFEALMAAMTGLRGINGIPWGVVIVFLGNLALGVIWLARYGRTLRAIRWNNF